MINFFTGITCPPLENLLNGQFSYSPSQENPIGTVATFICDQGYLLDGNSTRVCMDDDRADTIGVWSGEDPTCLGESL